MKFSEIVEPSGGWVNNTTGFFLVIGIYDRGYPTPTGSGNYENRNGVLVDPNGNTVDVFYDIVTQVVKYSGNVNQGTNGSMPVWNGSSVVNDPYSSPSFTQDIYNSTTFIIQKSKMLIPPGYKFSGFGYAIGFWLDDNEVREYILHTGESENIQISGNNNVIGPAVEENPANQSQEQNPNNIGKYLIGGPRW
ncbi:MAG: hypothetical protein QXH07_07190 [Thermoplasmata archaeon]